MSAEAQEMVIGRPTHVSYLAQYAAASLNRSRHLEGLAEARRLVIYRARWRMPVTRVIVGDSGTQN